MLVRCYSILTGLANISYYNLSFLPGVEWLLAAAGEQSKLSSVFVCAVPPEPKAVTVHLEELFSWHNVIKQIRVTEQSLIISSLVAVSVHTHGKARPVIFFFTVRSATLNIYIKGMGSCCLDDDGEVFHSPLDGATDLFCILASTVEFCGLVIIMCRAQPQPAVKHVSMLNPLNCSYEPSLYVFTF